LPVVAPAVGTTANATSAARDAAIRIGSAGAVGDCDGLEAGVGPDRAQQLLDVVANRLDAEVELAAISFVVRPRSSSSSTSACRGVR
jgi:hypothetical protein